MPNKRSHFAVFFLDKSFCHELLNISNFMLRNMMLALDLFDYLLKPDETNRIALAARRFLAGRVLLGSAWLQKSLESLSFAGKFPEILSDLARIFQG